jgi:hypothetical protein
MTDLQGLSDAELIRRIEAAPDFGWDDEGLELKRQLEPRGQGWRWLETRGHPKLEVIDTRTGRPLLRERLPRPRGRSVQRGDPTDRSSA